MQILTGQSEEFIVLGTVAASSDDLSLMAAYIGNEVDPQEVAIVEAVGFTDKRNSNGWQVESIDGIDCLGANMNYDHSQNQRESFGVIFAARNDGNTKICKVAIPKLPKNQDVITDLKFKVAKYTSPQITVTEWADEKNRIVRAGRLSHLSLVQNPAFGESNRVLSLAASMPDDPFSVLGQKIHAENVATATRLAERRSKGFTTKQLEEAKAKYSAMNPILLAQEVLPMLRELTGADLATTQKTLSPMTDHSSTKDAPAYGSVRRPVAYPYKTNSQEIK